MNNKEFFTAIAISREDIANVLEEEQRGWAYKLSDKDMEWIADKFEEQLLKTDWDIDLLTAINKFFEERKGQKIN